MLRHRVINPTAIVIFSGLLLLGFGTSMGLWPAMIVLFAWFLITLFGSFFIRWNYHLTSLHSNRAVSGPCISITFDDGPNNQFTPQVLDLLKQYGAKGTFFCIGKEVEKHPEIVKRILAEGHTIGNHTFSHSKSFGFLGTDAVIDELKRTNALVRQLTGHQMNLYRPAFGVTNPNIRKAVKSLKLLSVGWSVRSLDTTARSQTVILNRITKKIGKGDVVLLHDTSAKTVAVLEQLLLFLEKKKLQSIPVDQLLNIQAYA